MNYNEFVCECVMRLGTVIKPDTGKLAIQPAGYLNQAYALADMLVKQGFMSPTLETLRNKFEVYSRVLSEAFERRRSEQIRQCGKIPSISFEQRLEIMKGLHHEDRKVRDNTRRLLNQYEEMLALNLSQEVLELIKISVEPKREFYTVADLLLPELSDQIRKLEARKEGKEAPVGPAIERILNFLDFGREENVDDAIDDEQELIDNVDRHKKDDEFAKELHGEFIVISETERHVRKELWHVREAASKVDGHNDE
jgi:hypothetical protein